MSPDQKPTIHVLSGALAKLDQLAAVQDRLRSQLGQEAVEELPASNNTRWIKENKLAIQTYNDAIAQHGCFGESEREF